MKKLFFVACPFILSGCADLQWLVEPGPDGISPAVEAAGAASVVLATSAASGPAGWVLGGVGAALAAATVILRVRKIDNRKENQ